MSNKIKRIILLGPQGAGKSTQGSVMAKFLKLKEVSAGQILRQAILKKGKLSRELKAYVTPGLLVPDGFVIDLVMRQLKKPTYKNGFIIDGFPRSLRQARIFDKQFSIDKVFNFDISDREAVRRLSGRLVCQRGHIWHIRHNPPRQKGICDICGQLLFVRDDDRGRAIARRLAIYRRKTSKLLKYYKKSGKLVVINGEKPIKKISQSVIAYLKKNA
ncbi:MAG: adenylate kinase [Parcubacteria group bacterium]|nr:MAG: adenylate kinase [Parcubacteria group bacterium]